MSEPKPPTSEEFHEETPQEFANQPDRDFAKIPAAGETSPDTSTQDEAASGAESGSGEKSQDQARGD
jgi:hypothetical protein